MLIHICMYFYTINNILFFFKPSPSNTHINLSCESGKFENINLTLNVNMYIFNRV